MIVSCKEQSVVKIIHSIKVIHSILLALHTKYGYERISIHGGVTWQMHVIVRKDAG
jgi:hypothetical protein